MWIDVVLISAHFTMVAGSVVLTLSTHSPTHKSTLYVLLHVEATLPRMQIALTHYTTKNNKVNVKVKFEYRLLTPKLVIIFYFFKTFVTYLSSDESLHDLHDDSLHFFSLTFRQKKIRFCTEFLSRGIEKGS